MEDSLEAAILAAGFDDGDRDLATAGLCGTFALALHAALGSGRLALLCLNGADGRPKPAADGIPNWRHALLEVNGGLYDVDGRIELEHAVENYCWGNPGGDGGSLVYVPRGRMEDILKADSKSFDGRCLERWRGMLEHVFLRNRLEKSDGQFGPKAVA